MNRTYLFPVSLLILASVLAIFTHKSSLTPVLLPMLNLGFENPSEAANESFPFKIKTSFEIDNPEQSREEKYELVNYHDLAVYWLIYWISFFVWLTGFVWFFVAIALRNSSFKKLALFIGLAFTIYGLKCLYGGSAGLIITFDTMAMSGSDPDVFALDIGLLTQEVFIGWISFLAGSIAFFIGIINVSKGKVYKGGKGSKACLITAVLLCSFVIVGHILNLRAKLLLEELPFRTDLTLVANGISNFLISLAGSQLLLFFATIMVIISMALLKSDVQGIESLEEDSSSI